MTTANSNVHPLFQGILHTHIHPVTDNDKKRALSLAMDAKKEMPSWLRFQIIGQYGTAEDIARLAESMLCEQVN